MANYTTHLVAGSAAGIAVIIGGLQWAPGISLEACCLAFAAAYVGGLFPDLDHDTAIGLGEVAALLSTLLPVMAVANLVQQEIWLLVGLIPCHALFHAMARRLPFMGERMGLMASVRAVLVSAACSGLFLLLLRSPPWPHLHLWGAMAAAAAAVQLSLPIFKSLTVHRGIFHSVPAVGIYAAGFFLAAFRYSFEGRLLIAASALAAALSHLLLDELYSVDLMGARVKKSFGTALSLWKPKTPIISAFAWIACVLMIALCVAL